jgi:hypothetical protein
MIVTLAIPQIFNNKNNNNIYSPQQRMAPYAQGGSIHSSNEWQPAISKTTITLILYAK